MDTAMLLINVGLFAAAVAGLVCVVWLAFRVLDSPTDDSGPDGFWRRGDGADPRPPLPHEPHVEIVRAGRNELARSA